MRTAAGEEGGPVFYDIADVCTYSAAYRLAGHRFGCPEDAGPSGLSDRAGHCRCTDASYAASARHRRADHPLR